MTAPRDPARYPPEFREAFLAASTRGEFFIASVNPLRLRSRLWDFGRALRRSGESGLADAVQIHAGPDGLTLRHRSKTEEAMEIQAALKATGENPPDAADSALKRILGG